MIVTCSELERRMEEHNIKEDELNNWGMIVQQLLEANERLKIQVKATQSILGSPMTSLPTSSKTNLNTSVSSTQSARQGPIGVHRMQSTGAKPRDPASSTNKALESDISAITFNPDMDTPVRNHNMTQLQAAESSAVQPISVNPAKLPRLLNLSKSKSQSQSPSVGNTVVV